MFMFGSRSSGGRFIVAMRRGRRILTFKCIMGQKVAVKLRKLCDFDANVVKWLLYIGVYFKKSSVLSVNIAGMLTQTVPWSK